MKKILFLLLTLRVHARWVPLMGRMEVVVGRRSWWWAREGGGEDTLCLRKVGGCGGARGGGGDWRWGCDIPDTCLCEGEGGWHVQHVCVLFDMAMYFQVVSSSLT